MPASVDKLVEGIQRIWRSDPTAAFRSAIESRRVYPDSPAVLCAWGDLNQLSETAEYGLEESFAAYRRAADIDPLCAEAFESMGYFLDVVNDDPAAAEPHFRKAIELGGGAAQAGIPEYWIVDPETRTIHVLTLDGVEPGGPYRVQGEFKVGEIATSVLLADFAVSVGECFAAGDTL